MANSSPKAMPKAMHVVYETTPHHTRAALLDAHGNLCTLRHDEPTQPLVQGAVVWGRVRQVVPSLGSAFVDVGDIYDALVPLATLPPSTKLTQGQGLLVRITRGGFGEKGARLDARVAHAAPTSGPCPALLHAAPSALTRVLHDAGSAPVTVWLTDPRAKASVSKQVPEANLRLIEPAGPGTEWLEHLDDALATILSPRPTFAIPGGTAVVEITSAVATIDLNFSGQGVAGLPRPQAVQAFNLTAAEAVARLVRLLDLGGSVIVDFVTPKSRAEREAITAHLQATCTATDADFQECRPMSRHGLQELARARSGPSLQLLLATPAYVAGAALLQLARTLPGQWRGSTQQVVAHPSVVAHLKPLLTETFCHGHLGRAVSLVANPAYAPTSVSYNG
jgi:Ribonuclease G/E